MSSQKTLRARRYNSLELCYFTMNGTYDTFHIKMTDELIIRVLEVIRKCPDKLFMLMTKRSERMVSFKEHLDGLGNLILGVSVEKNKYKKRIEHLKAIDGVIKYIDFQPLLEKIELEDGELTGINFLSIGPEFYNAIADNKVRKFSTDFTKHIIWQCNREGIGFM